MHHGYIVSTRDGQAVAVPLVVPVDPDVARLEANLWSMFARFGRARGASLVDTPTRMAIATPIPQPPYNTVLRFYDEHNRSLDEQVSELTAPYRQRNVTMLWCVHPTTDPETRDALVRTGLVNAEELTGMVAEIRQVPSPTATPAGVEIVDADVEHAAAFADFVSWRYRLESTATPLLEEVFRDGVGRDVRVWFAMIDNVSVSKVAMHFTDGVAGIYGVATNEAGRGQGLASLLTLTAIEAARQMGIGHVVLHSTPMARSLYQRLGFRDVAPFELWSYNALTL